MNRLTKKEIALSILALANRLVHVWQNNLEDEEDAIVSATKTLWEMYQTAPGEPVFQAKQQLNSI